MTLTPERAERIALQAERMATYVLHAQEHKGRLLSEDEMVNISMRAKYEVGRLPEIQQDLMDQGEESPFRAYRIADRLASIEGRLYFEALQKDMKSPFNMPFMARRELDHHREELPHIAQNLMQRHLLSEGAAQHCAQDILRYRESHGQDPSSNQMEKMIQISQRLENKEYKSHDPEEVEFLRRKEGDLLFRHGLGYDASHDLDHAQIQAKRSLETLQRQMEREREHIHQRELSL